MTRLVSQRTPLDVPLRSEALPASSTRDVASQAAFHREYCPMTASIRTHSTWRLRTRTLSLGARTLVMGIVNITSDSFSDGGKFLDPEAAIAQALMLLDEGADIVDLGAESTRPGAQTGNSAQPPAVSAEEEQTRLLPVIEGILRARSDAILSIDTYKAATARAALQAGAEIVNDVSGFTWDAEMPAVCAAAQAGVVLMHTRGRPDQWRTQPPLPTDELLECVRNGLAASLVTASEAGIQSEAIVLDPGYGFGKRFDENYALLARQAELLALGRPLLAGISRKSFLAHTLNSVPCGGASVEARENASLAAMTAAILNGASMVRVHAVRPVVHAARIADAILAASEPK